MASSTLMQNFEIALIEAGCKAVYRIESVRSQRGKLLSVEFGCCSGLHENVARAFQEKTSEGVAAQQKLCDDSPEFGGIVVV